MDSLTRFPRSMEITRLFWAVHPPSLALFSLASGVARHFLPHMCTSVFRVCTCQGQLSAYSCHAFFPFCGVLVVSRIQKESLGVVSGNMNEEREALRVQKKKSVSQLLCS